MLEMTNPASRGETAGLGFVDQRHADDNRLHSARSNDQQALAAHRETRRRRLAAQVHALGPAPMLYLLAEIAAGADLDERLAVYADLPGDFIREVGGRDFPAPMLALSGGRA